MDHNRPVVWSEEIARLQVKIERQAEALKIAYDFMVECGAVNMAALMKRAWEDQSA